MWSLVLLVHCLVFVLPTCLNGLRPQKRTGLRARLVDREKNKKSGSLRPGGCFVCALHVLLCSVQWKNRGEDPSSICPILLMANFAACPRHVYEVMHSCLSCLHFGRPCTGLLE
mmetsp:Transcript_55171/g.179316  ORF Transcript_55171/g.179316 Transcript_55171/m.179316 type:complete len:114 (+) Transcript_55171:252-593(+)